MCFKTSKGEEAYNLPNCMQRICTIDMLACTMMSQKQSSSLSENTAAQSDTFKKVNGKTIIPPAGAIGGFDEMLSALSMLLDHSTTSDACGADAAAADSSTSVRLMSKYPSRTVAACEAIKLCLRSLLCCWEKSQLRLLLTLAYEGKETSKFIAESCVKLVKEACSQGKYPVDNWSFQGSHVFNAPSPLMYG
jgi:hypothetical protein